MKRNCAEEHGGGAQQKLQTRACFFYPAPFKTPQLAAWVTNIPFSAELNTPWKKGAGFIGKTVKNRNNQNLIRNIACIREHGLVVSSRKAGLLPNLFKNTQGACFTRIIFSNFLNTYPKLDCQ